MRACRHEVVLDVQGLVGVERLEVLVGALHLDVAGEVAGAAPATDDDRVGPAQRGEEHGALGIALTVEVLGARGDARLGQDGQLVRQRVLEATEVVTQLIAEVVDQVIGDPVGQQLVIARQQVVVVVAVLVLEGVLDLVLVHDPGQGGHQGGGDDVPVDAEGDQWVEVALRGDHGPDGLAGLHVEGAHDERLVLADGAGELAGAAAVVVAAEHEDEQAGDCGRDRDADEREQADRQRALRTTVGGRGAPGQRGAHGRCGRGGRSDRGADRRRASAGRVRGHDAGVGDLVGPGRSVPVPVLVSPEGVGLPAGLRGSALVTHVVASGSGFVRSDGSVVARRVAPDPPRAAPSDPPAQVGTRLRTMAKRGSERTGARSGSPSRRPMSRKPRSMAFPNQAIAPSRSPDLAFAQATL